MAYRSSAITTVATGSGGTNAMTMPAGVVSGDQLLAFLSGDGASATWTATGWTSIGSNTVATPDGQSFAVFTRISNGTEGASQTFTYSGSGGISCVIAAFNGRTSSALTSANVSATTNATGNASPVSMGATGITASANDDLALFYGNDDGTTTDTFAYSTPTGYTARQSTTTNTNFNACTFFTQDNVGAGATGTVTCTATITGAGTSGWGAYLVRIPVAAAASDPVGQICI